MEKKSEGSASPKSSASKVSTPPPSTKSQSNGTIIDDTYQGKSTQETPSDGRSPAAPCIDESKLSHPIISVDIKKSAPNESKPADNALESGTIKTDDDVMKQTKVVATVVTNAVVNEAALAVETKEPSAAKKVDDTVQKELRRIDEASSADVSSKPMVNGDLSSKNVSPDEVEAKELNLSADQTHISKPDSVVSKKEDNGSCNGVAGIFVVETISKKEGRDNQRIEETQTEQVKDKDASNGLVKKNTDKSETESKNENPELKQQDEALSEKDAIGESIVKINDSKDQILPDKDDYKPGNDSHKIDVLTSVDKTKTDNVTDAAKLLEAGGDNNADEGQNITDCAKLSVKIANSSSSTETESVKSKSDDVEQKVDDALSEKSSYPIASGSDQAIKETNASDSEVLEENKLDDNQSEVLNASDETIDKALPVKDEGTSTASNPSSTDPNIPSETVQTTDRPSAEYQSDVKHESIDSGLKGAASEASAEDSGETSTAEAAELKKEAPVAFSGALSEDDSIESRIIPEDSKSDNGRVEEGTQTSKEAEPPTASKHAGPSEIVAELSCAVAAIRGAPETCDVAVGADEVRMVRVASGDGLLEEIDGEQATTEVEVTEDSVPVNAPSPEVTEPTDGQASPTDDRSASPNSAHTVSSASSKPSSARSSDVTVVEVKPPSAVSRSSIPEAVVYEPPERRKSAVSAVASEADEAEDDAKEGEKSEKMEEEQVTENTDGKETEEKEVETGATAEDREAIEEPTTVAENETEIQSVTESNEPDCEAVTAETGEEEASGIETDPTVESDAKQESLENVEVEEESPAKDAEKEEVDSAAASEDKAEPETDEKEDENLEGADEADVQDEKGEAEDAAKEESDAQSAKEDVETQEEPATLVGESACEKEAGASEDKESEDTEKEGASSEEKEQEHHEKEEEMEQVQEAIESKEETKTEDAEPQAESETTDDAANQDEQAKDEDEAKEPEAAEVEAPAPAEDEKKDEEPPAPEPKEQEKEPSPRSPTKRTRSPDKLGRRGVSPLSSPPKLPKAPTSPQKPQKTPSPKKKNGMLSPIKTPKTPGSDTRKLPPIKAPVGLAPNPNLKNIRSKIGSFDNIRYKPGGGDKKVISKKLEWKAAPKIGSLDYTSYKGNEKKKERSKSESKEAKSPAISGDEAEVEGATAGAVTDSLANPDETGSTELPVAIAAES